MQFTLPVPPFKFSEFIDDKAQTFCKHHLQEGWLSSPQDIELIEKELSKLNKSEHRIQFLGFVSNYITILFSEHEKVCKNSTECGQKQEFREIIYFIYGEIERLGIPVDYESFDTQDIISNNEVIDKITAKIDELKVGENIIFDDVQLVLESIEALKKDIQGLKEMYPVGKKKWTQLAKGMVGEYAANKTLDIFIAAILPQIMELIKNNQHLLN